jgi:hypothetical protein
MEYRYINLLLFFFRFTESRKEMINWIKTAPVLPSCGPVAMQVAEVGKYIVTLA